MNSVLEYVRQLNQQSVTLRDEWLDRLRFVECEPGTFSLSPEIALTKKPNLRSSDSAIHEAPYTVVSSNDPASSVKRSADSNNAKDLAATELPAGNAKSIEVIDESPAEPQPGISYSPMDRLRELLGEELQVHGGSYEAIREVEPSSSPAKNHGVTIKSEIKTAPDARHSAIPSPHVSIPARRPTELHELRSTFDEDEVDDSPIASVPFGDDALGETGSRPSGSSGPTAGTVRLPELRDHLTELEGKKHEDRPQSVPTRPSALRPERPTHDSQVDETLSILPRSIDRITDQLLERFPVVASATIMFAALGPRNDVDNVAAKVATCLANRDVGGILLIDGNSRSRGLTSLMGDLHAPGFSELVNRSESLSAVVSSTENDNLEFLPFGNGDVTHRRLDATRATALGREFNQAFQYTIISAGCISDSATRHWSGYVDAVYLLIDLKNADRRSTMDSLTALRQQAVRIAGIIAVEE